MPSSEFNLYFILRSHEYHGETMNNVRIANQMYKDKHGIDPCCAIALDTKGPEIRTGLLEGVSTLNFYSLEDTFARLVLN